MTCSSSATAITPARPTTGVSEVTKWPPTWPNPQASVDAAPWAKKIDVMPHSSCPDSLRQVALRGRLLSEAESGVVAASISDDEALELLLAPVFGPTVDARLVIRTLLTRFGSLSHLLGAPPSVLLSVPGLGPASVAALKLVGLAALRLAQGQIRAQPLVDSWDRLLDYLYIALARETVEQFRVLYLDPRNRLILDEVHARGTVDFAPVMPREVARRALEVGATAIILVHNHPSGDPTPSTADVEVTTEVAAAVGALGITVHDHLIVGNGRHASLAALGLVARTWPRR